MALTKGGLVKRISRPEMEKRRLSASEKFEAKMSHGAFAALAKEVGVSRQSVLRWYSTWKTRGTEGLRSTIATGRPRLITPEQRKLLQREYLAGPQVRGLGPHWTYRAFALVVREETGVSYNHTHIGRLIKQMGLRQPISL